jgi:DNA-binding CsgD family transcriptional regulator
MLTAGPKLALAPACRARDLAARLGPRLRTTAQAVWGMTAIQTGDPAGIAAAEPAAPWLLPARAPPAADGEIAGADADWGVINGFAFSMMLVERLAESERAFAMLRASDDGTSDPVVNAMLADGHGYVLTRMGRLDAALEAIDAALSLSDLAPVVESFAGVGRAYIQLYRGDLDDSAAWCEQVLAKATARGDWNALLFAWDVLGHRALRAGDPGQACDYYAQLEATIGRMGIGEPCLPPWPRHAVAAYLAAGQVGDAERVLAWVEDRARPLPCRFPRIAAATGRAWLAEFRGDHDEAAARFGEALALHQDVDLPVEHAETLLGYGGFLRRRGQPARARRVLAQAIGVAEAAQAGWLAGLAHAELRVAGGRRRPAARELTAQESRVAALAATGAGNPQIARQLSVSVSTVETHLERIYAKLGIHSRRELIAITAARGSVPSGTGAGTAVRPDPPGTGKD